MKKFHELIIIAGPCAAEDKQQILKTAHVLHDNGIKIIRAALWKPRTALGFSGVGIRGLDWLIEAAQRYDLTIATEVMLPEHVRQIGQKIKNKSIKILLWIGSRNQNHLIQQAIGKEILKEIPLAKLMIKNQPWKNYNHWRGIINYIQNENINPKKMLICHRGFQPESEKTITNYRNQPDIKMMNRIRKETGLPMIFDVSHTGGTRKNVFKITRELVETKAKFDGLMVEIHPHPQLAKTDSQQQLNFIEFKKFIKMVSNILS